MGRASLARMRQEAPQLKSLIRDSTGFHGQNQQPTGVNDVLPCHYPSATLASGRQSFGLFLTVG
jgi:hypothetical protein